MAPILLPLSSALGHAIPLAGSVLTGGSVAAGAAATGATVAGAAYAGSKGVEAIKAPQKEAAKQAKRTVSQLSQLRSDPARRVAVMQGKQEMTARARAQRLARGRLSTRSTWLSPAGELKSILGG